jgi:Na+/H+ antiporter NhaD/arsenite permease-like protein
MGDSMVEWVAAGPILVIFLLGYLAIIFEEPLGINKTASALVAAVMAWAALFLFQPGNHDTHVAELGFHMEAVSEIVFFLLAAMAIVELIDSHQGFNLVNQIIRTRKRRHLLWLVGGTAFFLSAVLDNLTTTIVMISLLRKLLPLKEERLIFACTVVVAANAGGVWTPIGDVTTTMLWIADRITTLPTMAWLLLPSLAGLITYCLLVSRRLKGTIPTSQHHDPQPLEPGGALVLPLGLASLIFVPIFKTITGLPPYMGALIGLGALWTTTDILHPPKSGRHHLRIPHILTRIDTPGVLFFLGILMAVAALETSGLLSALAGWINANLSSELLLAGIIGLVSAIIDNVPLVAATIGMYTVDQKPIDSNFWQLIALAAGTGGSILSVGSAAGVALMGLEGVSFIWYLKNTSLIALASFAMGLLTYAAIAF